MDEVGKEHRRDLGVEHLLPVPEPGPAVVMRQKDAGRWRRPEVLLPEILYREVQVAVHAQHPGRLAVEIETRPDLADRLARAALGVAADRHHLAADRVLHGGRAGDAIDDD